MTGQICCTSLYDWTDHDAISQLMAHLRASFLLNDGLEHQLSRAQSAMHVSVQLDDQL
jgi:hypothetical protein